MRLKCIKLAGFKSFVDPTTISFPTNLTSIVGPNGCGKSNTIDAVRWVMGESSAKNLRGDSMTDVIFNGSSSRKPTAQASVELVFDNSDGTLTGEYAGYAEISIKRLVTRDAQSSYYLNGTKCRRKDITDIFLGTGMGPRSYAIIEQGMISKLIEAKPDELRSFIEEAAGISKYKERRRETELRMKHTRENLDRLNDLREELERQLSHLQRQASAAEKYKEYKEEERLLKAQLQALRWRVLDNAAGNQSGAIAGLEVKFEAFIADQRAMDNEIEKQRDLNSEQNDHFNAVQGRYYSVGADIARLEQTLQHSKERLQQLKEDLAEIERSYDANNQHLQSDNQQVEELNIRLEESAPKFEEIRLQEALSAEQLFAAEENMQSWQVEWDGFNAQAQEPRERAQLEQSKIQHLENSVQRLRERVQRLIKEEETLSIGSLDSELELLNEQITEAEINVEAVQSTVQEWVEQINVQRERNNQSNNELDSARSQMQTLKGRQASFQALQQAALGTQKGAVVEWLKQNGLAEKLRLAQQIHVDSGWENAVETVLGPHLQAVCIDSLDAVSSVLASLEKGSISFLDNASVNAAPARSGFITLASKLRSNVSTMGLLGGIYAAEDLVSALALRAQLQAHESVITPEGIWIGPNWLRVARDDDAQAGVLQRQQELEQLDQQIEELAERVELLQQALSDGRAQLREFEQNREDAQRNVSSASRRLGELKAQISAKQARLEQVQMRRDRLQKELEECHEQERIEQEQIREARMILQAALDVMAEDTEKREQLLRQRDELRAQLDSIRQRARQDKDAAHQLQLQVQSLKTQLDSTKMGMERLRIQIQQLAEKRESLQQSLENADNPLEEQHALLEELLQRRMQVEEELNAARRQLEESEQKLRLAEKKRHEAEQSAYSVRSQLDGLKMEWQAMQVRRQSLQEQLAETQFDLQTVLDNLPADADMEKWEEELEKISQRISRLGAINLAAIDEYQQQSERKTYLDAQNQDLNEALETLENAIKKIDRETRTRFKETFDKVNKGLQELFPKVFGGGHAYLELTGEDLLDTGVAIMARPPGKRNSTIHLLSGGEKALTAIALVFSIFQLNPAPFCMLDEVDAPLDDANVGRYSRMVEEMSEKVQFIYITHNKIAMEMAKQLLGVTMHEPGVSRIVSVNVEEAAAMAAL